MCAPPHASLQLAPVDAWVAHHMAARRAGHPALRSHVAWQRCVTFALGALHALGLPQQALGHVLAVWVSRSLVA